MFGLCHGTETSTHRTARLINNNNIDTNKQTYVEDEDAVWNRADAPMPCFFQLQNCRCALQPEQFESYSKAASQLHSPGKEPSHFGERKHEYINEDAPSGEYTHTVSQANSESAFPFREEEVFSPLDVPTPLFRQKKIREFTTLTDDMTDEDRRGIQTMKEQLRSLNASRRAGDTYNHYTEADGFTGVPLPRVPLDPHPKYTLMRFLRARKHDVDEAVKAYMDTLKWRQENGVDAMLDEDDPCEAYYQCMAPHRDHGFDRKGHPIYFEATGRVRAPKMLKIGKEAGVTVETIIRRNTKHMEYLNRLCRQQSEKTGRYVGKVIVVYDMTDMAYSLDSASIDMFKMVTRNNTNYYPETMWKTYIINAPMTFRAVWAMVKPFLDPVVVTKISILGKKYLDKMVQGQSGADAGIALDQIPASLGGQCTCGGEHSNGDGCIPPVRDPLTTAPEDVPKCKWVELREYKVHPQY